MAYKYLDKVSTVSDLQGLPETDIIPLCADIRDFLLSSVGKSGGHLASNLGVVELSVALHRIFNSPADHIIFDVGHQAYVHKLLTGRKEEFCNLRRPGGLSGFTSMKESEHDAFGAGHSSTSVSAALGYAESDKVLGKQSHTVAVIGDGAYTGGMVHEALNNCKPDLRLVIVLNENGMSISTNKGAFASYLSRVRISKSYRGVKRGTTSALNHIPIVGRPIKAVLSFVKKVLKKVFFTSNYFEDLGLYYIGPIDGNDYKKVEWALAEAKSLNQCVIVHLKTTKGKGLAEAEQSPEEYHSITNAGKDSSTFHSELSEELINLAEGDERITAVVAAMGAGTGLNKFEMRYPDRYFDVGIAEEHALTFSAGLAAGGLKPFAAIYSTFLQRGYDNIVHDIALQGLPVRMLIDRAGIAVSDGATHHGIFDVAFLSHIPGVEIISPATYGSLRSALGYINDVSGPSALRYPNAKERADVVSRFYADINYGKPGVRCDFDPKDPPKNIFVTYGTQVERVIDAVKLLSNKGIECGIVLVERIKPYDDAADFLCSIIKPDTHIVYAEEGIKNGGAAMITRSILTERGALANGAVFDIAAIEDNFVIPDTLCDIYDYAGLSEGKLAAYFTE